jgi:hypothetical protein
VPGIPQLKEKNKEKETFQKQSAMLEEFVKLPLALVWHGPDMYGYPMGRVTTRGLHVLVRTW